MSADRIAQLERQVELEQTHNRHIRDFRGTHAPVFAARIPKSDRLRFDNLLLEAKWAFHGGNARLAQELLAEAQVMAMAERRLQEEGIA